MLIVLLLNVRVLAITDPSESSVQARLMRLAQEERALSSSFRGNGFAMLQPRLWEQQVQPQLRATTADQRPPTMTLLLDTTNKLPVGTSVQRLRSPASLVGAVAEPTTKAPVNSNTCSPACKEGQGLCVNGICLCHGPWSGQSCEVAEATADEVPFEKGVYKVVGPESGIGEALKQKVVMPFAIFIWTTVLVITFFCTALCPQLCGRRSGGSDSAGDYDQYDFERQETQFDIVEAWTFDNRKRQQREEQNDFTRREWFEERVGTKLKKTEFSKVRH